MVMEIEKAIEVVTSGATIVGTEEVALEEAAGRVLAIEVTAGLNVPPFDRSSLDGYALNSEGTKEASSKEPVKLKILETVGAGFSFGGEVPENCCVRIMTGAPLPGGTNAVVAQEKVTVKEGYILVESPLVPEEGMVRAGQEIKESEKVMDKGTLLHPPQLGILADLGYALVCVYKKPLLGIVSTGAELVSPGTSRGENNIYESNSIIMGALVKACGGEFIKYGPVPDSEEELVKAVEDAFSRCDAVITTGGISQGDYDLMPRVMERCGIEVLISSLDVRPGTFSAAGKRSGKWIFSLSGSPPAARMIFELLVRPFILVSAGNCRWKRPAVKAVLQHSLINRGDKKLVSKGWCYFSRGEYYVQIPRVKAKSTGSGVPPGWGRRENSMLVLPPSGQPLKQGDKIEVKLTELPEVEN